MSTFPCPHCSADLSKPQSVRIAHYHFGHLDKTPGGTLEDPGFRQHLEVPDNYTITCNSCMRLVRTLPLP